MIFRDNLLVPPADYRKMQLLYASAYTPANIDMAIEWTVTVKAADPAGKPVPGVHVIALERDRDWREGMQIVPRYYEVASGITGGDGTAKIPLVDYRIIGGPKGPIEKRGPYRIEAKGAAPEPVKVDVELKEPTEAPVTLLDPKRKLYVYAGLDQRRKIGETATLEGSVAAADDPAAKPEIAWKQVGGPAPLAIANPKSAKTQVVMAQNGEWTFELEAKFGGEVAKDSVKVRADANLTPTAVAECPKTAKVNTIVQLDATKSTDPRRFPPEEIRYEWKQVGGPEAILSSAEWPNPIFYPEKAGPYEFEVRVSNPLRTSDPARCSVTVTEQ
jgi:hypothetical protein